MAKSEHLLVDSASRVYIWTYGQSSLEQVASFSGLGLTDIAVTEDGTVYGISFSRLYELDLVEETYTQRQSFAASMNGLEAVGNKLWVSGLSGSVSVLSLTLRKIGRFAGL